MTEFALLPSQTSEKELVKKLDNNNNILDENRIVLY